MIYQQKTVFQYRVCQIISTTANKDGSTATRGFGLGKIIKKLNFSSPFPVKRFLFPKNQYIQHTKYGISQKTRLLASIVTLGVASVTTATPTFAASFSFENLGFDPEEIVSGAQGKIENQINDLIGPISELLAIDPNDFLDDVLSDLKLPDLDISSISGDMNIPNPNQLLEELQNIGTADFASAMQLGSSVPDNLLLVNEATVELTGKLAKSVAESSALGEDAQVKIKEKIEFGNETTTTSAELAAATQNLAEQAKTLVADGESTDVTQELERLQLDAMGLQIQAEATQSSQLSILATQQAALFTETQQARIDNAFRNQLLSDISKNLQGSNAGSRVEKSANIRALANGSQFSTFKESE